VRGGQRPQGPSVARYGPQHEAPSLIPEYGITTGKGLIKRPVPLGLCPMSMPMARQVPSAASQARNEASDRFVKRKCIAVRGIFTLLVISQSYILT
jgi:hypothetical protein